MKTNEILLKGFEDAVSERVNDIFGKLKNDFEQLSNKIITSMNTALETQPVKKITVNNIEAKEISGTVSPLIDRAVFNAKLGLNTLFVGPAGCGKTTLACQVAEVLDVPFYTVCLTAGASETWLFGRQTPSGFVEGAFSKAYRNGGVFLADEIDAADANLLLSINTALSHDEMYNPISGETIKKHENFFMFAASNTNGRGGDHLYTGRSRLDGATLDRFVVVKVDYNAKLERELCPDHKIRNFLLALRDKLKENHCEEFISTRQFKAIHNQVVSGASPYTAIQGLVCTWSDVARDTAEDVFKQHFKKIQKDNFVTVIREPKPTDTDKIAITSNEINEIIDELFQSADDSKQETISNQLPF